MKAVRLRTEYLENPLGIDLPHPRLFWNCEGGVRQTARRILAREGDTVLWDSGKVRSDSMRAEYPLPLSSRQRVCWEVTLWDETDTPGEPAGAVFETGLLSPADFHAAWITGNYRPNPKKRYPVDCFRKCFRLESVASARLYITACGLYEARINGARVGNFVLAPGHTDYTRRIQLQTYDVTPLLRTDENQLTAELADGWYRGSCGAWGRRNQYGRETRLWAQLEVTDAAGETRIIGTDGSWEWSDDGPIRFADNKDGEVVDARMSPTYAGRARVTSHPVRPTASDNVPVTEHETFRPVLLRTPQGQTVLDFGQNIAGYLSFGLTAKAGQTLRLRFGELLDSAGEFTQQNIQLTMRGRTTPLQEVRYTCREGENVYKTKFAIFGFRYVLVETGIPFSPDDFTAIAVSSDLEETARFSCSDDLINRLVACTRWSAKNNHADVPTDCPTRERHGWTGDAQIFCNTACYLFDYAPFARKYMADMADGQRRDGRFRQISPRGGIDFYMNCMDGSAGWSDAGIFIPYRIWKRYGDRRVLEENYDRMRRFAMFLCRRMGRWYPTARPTGVARRYRKHLLNAGQSYGEWAEPDDVHHMTWKDCAVPHPEVATAYASYAFSLMSEIADALEKPDDSAFFAKKAAQTRAAYNALADSPRFPLDTDRQARLVRGLYFGLFDPAHSEYAARRLVEALDRYGWRVGTGFLSTPLILFVLEAINPEYAYRLLENKDMPGWLFMPKMGATTIWEAWEGTETKNGGIASLDHYSKGAVCEWIFSRMCGIRVAGENRFDISPVPGGTLRSASLTYRSVYGSVGCRWERTDDGKTVYTLEIPANTQADFTAPGIQKVLTAGSYRFEVVSPEEKTLEDPAR